MIFETCGQPVERRIMHLRRRWYCMRKLPEVQQAKELMNEAIDWSVFRWMIEKPRVRETADLANDALDRLEQTVKASWSDQLKAVSSELSGKASGVSRRRQKGQQPPQ